MANEKISQLPAAGSLTGTELIETVQGGNSKQTTMAAIAALASAGLPYKVYTAFLSLDGGTGAITVLQLQNTIGDGSGNGTTDIAWSAFFTGALKAQMTTGNPFTANKTVGITGNINDGGQLFFPFLYQGTTTFCEMDVIKVDGTQPEIPGFSQLYVEIRVYP